jgi:phosphate:Na+ symporter
LNPLITSAAAAVGGLGLFLLAVGMISEGLRAAAGGNLRKLLGRWTHNSLRGVLSGMLFTGLVQSSSAVTVATIGFVNAGLLGLHQAMGVVFGANVGTTMTGWLVAAVGFEFKLEVYALPLVGIGMLLRLTGPGRRRGALGWALAGFGLFFIGIEVLAGAFAGISTSLQLDQVAGAGPLAVLGFLGIGFAMTLITQSSSAAIAMILTAATGGILSLAAAAAMVIGANIGTTSTAALAVIGATPNAKRVAAAHILFNVLTGVVALLLLPGLLWFVRVAEDVLGLQDLPAVSLALFHTVFNLLGVLLMLPLAGYLAGFLEQRFRSAEEIEGRPRYLDQNVAASPSLAINALAMELARMAAIARRACQAAVSVEQSVGMQIPRDVRSIESLNVAVGKFVAHLERGTLPQEVTGELPMVLRTTQYFVVAGELALATARIQTSLVPVGDAASIGQLDAFHAQLALVLEHADIERADFSMADCDEGMVELDERYHAAKTQLLEAGSLGRIEVSLLAEVLEQMNQVRRMARQLVKGVRLLTRLYPAEREQVAAPVAPPLPAEINGNGVV